MVHGEKGPTSGSYWLSPGTNWRVASSALTSTRTSIRNWGLACAKARTRRVGGGSRFGDESLRFGCVYHTLQVEISHRRSEYLKWRSVRTRRKSKWRAAKIHD